jgi:hypothetical protein
MQVISTKTKTHKLLTALQAGEVLTSSQIAKRFSIGNPTAEVTRIRQAGFVVYANKRTAGNGVRVTEYRTGKASRAIIAAGYKAMSMGLV